MSSDKPTNIDCPVEFQEGGTKFGQFANAFRILPDSGSECFIDFCVYSAQENVAQVVSRIRVHRNFLSIIRDRLNAELFNMGENPIVVKDGLAQTRDGRIVFFNPPKGEN